MSEYLNSKISTELPLFYIDQSHPQSSPSPYSFFFFFFLARHSHPFVWITSASGALIR